MWKVRWKLNSKVNQEIEYLNYKWTKKLFPTDQLEVRSYEKSKNKGWLKVKIYPQNPYFDFKRCHQSFRAQK